VARAEIRRLQKQVAKLSLRFFRSNISSIFDLSVRRGKLSGIGSSKVDYRLKETGIMAINSFAAKVCYLAISLFSSSACSASHNTQTELIQQFFTRSLLIPGEWKVIDEPKWGIRFKAPTSIKEERKSDKGDWVHSDDRLSLIISFEKNPSQNQLRRKIAYQETAGHKSELRSRICYYEEQSIMNQMAIKRIIALYFLDKRETLGAPNEPSFKVEYFSEGDQQNAYRILQTVELYSP
jgi:hypothetical protein